MSDIVGKVLGVILAFILCILAPLTVAVMSDDMTDRRAIYGDMTNFIDEVVDTATITQEQLEDLYASINARGPICEIKITRYMRAANPDTNGEIEITYMPVDVTIGTAGNNIISKFNQGDLIKISVIARDYSGIQKVGRAILGGFLTPIDLSVTARVR